MFYESFLNQDGEQLISIADMLYKEEECGGTIELVPTKIRQYVKGEDSDNAEELDISRYYQQGSQSFIIEDASKPMEKPMRTEIAYEISIIGLNLSDSYPGLIIKQNVP